MEFNDRKKEIGAAVRKFRKEKGLSQKQLIYARGEKYPVLSENALIAIEKGKTLPKQETLDIVLSILDKTMSDLLEEIDREAKVSFNNAIENISLLVSNHKYSEANILLMSLKEDEIVYNKVDPANRQIVGFYEGVFAYKLHKDPTQALKILKEELAIRRPAVFSKKKKELDIDRIDNDKLAKESLSFIDYRMLSSISNIKFDIGLYDESVEILYSVIKSLNTKLVAKSVKDNMLNMIYFNLSNNLKKLKRYSEALEVCDLGIVLCKVIKTTKTLGELYSNKGEIYGYLKDIEKAHHFYKLSCDQFIRDDEPEKLEITRNGALEVHGISVDISS